MASLRSEDGQEFVKSLAQFIRQHERALANSLQLLVHRKQNTATSLSTPSSGNTNLNQSAPNPLAAALSFAGLNFRSHSIKAALLTLTPHHLFYLLTRMEELGIDVGSMSIRLETLNHEHSQSNYVSFLPGHKARGKGRSDNDSMHSVSSMRSVMSSMTTFWSSIGLGSSSSKTEKAKAAAEAEVKYIYSAFTKLPSLRLTTDYRARMIQGFEEFPFDTAVPLFAFKNLQQLDIVDLDFRHFYGWDRLAENLSLLTVKRANLNDPSELLTDIVLDDAEKRRNRSAKGGRSSPTPIAPRSVPSTPPTEYAHSHSDSGSPEGPDLRREDPPAKKDLEIVGMPSPKRPSTARPASSYRHVRSYSSKINRSGSGSSNSSEYSLRPNRNESSSSLLSLNVLPPTKWQRLKYLSLADNALTSISARSLAPVAGTLRSLNLSSNLFTEIPDSLASLTRLTSLDLSNCMISSLQSLTKSPIPAITTIKLKSNRLTSLAGVERLLSLENLNVQDNILSDPMEAARLTNLPNIRKIWLRSNPFTRQQSGSYRVQIFNLFRTTPGYVEDIIIDDHGPDYSERKALVDRVPEKEHQLSQPTIRIAEVPVMPPVKDERNPSAQALHEAKISMRRKHMPRRRVVELTQEDGPWRSQSDSPIPIRHSLDGNSTKRASIDIEGFRKELNETKQAPQEGDQSLSDEMVDTTASSKQEDEYRIKAEELRRQLGNNWLSALEEQVWHSDHHLEVQRGQSSQTLAHPGPLHRTNSLGPIIVNGGRSLG